MAKLLKLLGITVAMVAIFSIFLHYNVVSIEYVTTKKKSQKEIANPPLKNKNYQTLGRQDTTNETPERKTFVQGVQAQMRRCAKNFSLLIEDDNSNGFYRLDICYQDIDPLYKSW